jgi:heme exporter protein CcmD
MGSGIIRMSAFQSVDSFLRMGGYAASVWSAYGIVLLLLISRIWAVKRKLKRLQKTLMIKHADPS